MGAILVIAYIAMPFLVVAWMMRDPAYRMPLGIAVSSPALASMLYFLRATEDAPAAAERSCSGMGLDYAVCSSSGSVESLASAWWVFLVIGFIALVAAMTESAARRQPAEEE